MSSTNRGVERNQLDDYSTPSWCVRRLLESAIPLPLNGLWLEPCAGEGRIIKAVDDFDRARNQGRAKWHSVEIQRKYLAKLKKISTPLIQDFRTFNNKIRYDLAITNPPFYIAQEVVQHSLGMSDRVIVLQRMNWLGGASQRISWLRGLYPTMWVLPDRPQFGNLAHKYILRADLEHVYEQCNRCKKRRDRIEEEKLECKGTDSVEYAWFDFDYKQRIQGKYVILNDTPLAERRLG